MPQEDVSSISILRLNDLGAFTRSNLERDLPSSTELLLRLEEAVRGFYLGLELSRGEFCRPSMEPARKVDLFQAKLQRLDNEIRLVRELVYTVLAKFPVPAC
jgi:hypothetical protein